jgi:hypothetical protein
LFLLWAALSMTHFRLALGLLTAGTAIQLVLGSIWNRRRRIDVGVIQLGDGVLRLDGRTLFTRESIRHVHVAEQDGVWTVRLHRGWGAIRTIDLETVQKRDARGLEEALGCGRTRSLTPFTVWLDYERMIGWAFAATVAMVACAFATGAVALFGWFAALNAILIWHTWYVRVGADGVELRRFRSVRFVAFADIADLRIVGRHLSIDRRIEPPLTLSHGAWGPTLARLLGHDVLHFHALREAIEDGRAALAVRSQPAVACPARGGRTLEAWVEDVRRAAAGNTTYRVPALPREILFTVAFDEAQAPAVRVGAVLAVAPELDEATREQMRSAARKAASTEVRYALAAAGHGDDRGLLTAASWLR